MDELLDFDFLSPKWLMTPEEFRAARKSEREIRLAHEKKRVLLDEKLRDYELRVAKVNTKIDGLKASQDLLCESILKREIGLERFMVLKVVRYDGYSANLQALEFGLSDFGPTDRLAWHIDGRAPRKDGSLGVKCKSITFDFARIERRKLDGTWERLTLHEPNDESESE